ncbi:ABC transporter permease subunit [Natrialba taiwanensis]|uniref:ABC transporter n=1 Tax=Natrialba taiwanensis DSM 12281 TaxID=1230458 RepID=M0A1K2_9EURY|nr:ABC transporter permease subunit [Natrialba taiwanensis]ELY92625.1 ABC transporter [Natrialba taiwanensis DSM 12281]
MNAISVAKRDLLDVRRAKLIWVPVALYVLFMLLFYWGQSNSMNPSFYRIMLSLATIGGVLLIPLVALVAAYLSVAGERESGSVRYQLSLPVSRTDVVLGKLLSRVSVVSGALLASFAIGLVAAWTLVPEMSVEYGDYAVFVALTLLYALAYVSIAVAISAATASRSRAMGGAIGFFFVFNIIWNFLPIGPEYMARFVFEELGLSYADSHLEFIFSLSPTGAYLNGLGLAFPAEQFPGLVGSGFDVFYLQEWFMLVILVAWVVVPLGLGIWRFRRADLG